MTQGPVHDASRTHLIHAPHQQGFFALVVVAVLILNIDAVVRSHAQGQRLAERRIGLVEIVGINLGERTLEFLGKDIVQGFSFFEGLRFGHVIQSHRSRHLHLRNSIGNHHLRLELDFGIFDRNGIDIREVIRSLEHEGVHATGQRINARRNILHTGRNRGHLQIRNLGFNRHDTGAIRFLKHLPLAVLLEIELGNTRRIDIVLVEINVGFVLERAGILRCVEAHQHHFGRFQVVVRHTERMELIVVFEVNRTGEPEVFLRALLMAQEHDTRLERNHGRLRKDHIAFLDNRHIGDWLKGNAFLEHHRGDPKVLVAVCQRKNREQQQERKQSF